ncbi:MAG: SHOCT domain-containing protein [Firmicutes bacterium]|nr:SHOCT domain-containing protein [Bacillota bacterium]
MGLLEKKTAELKPNFETNYMGFWIKVFPTRVEFKAGAGSQNIPINQVASIQIGMMGLMQIIIESTGGQKYTIPTSKKKEVKDAIYAAQEAFNASQGSSNVSIADELTKLAQLKDQGILSESEFEAQKKKLLD